MDVLRYDVDCVGDGRISISYFVSGAFAERFGLPEPSDVPSVPEFEEKHSTAFDGLLAVCDQCFDEFTTRSTAIQTYNTRALDSLDFEPVLGRLKRGVEGLVLERTALLPEAGVLCCTYKGKRFNIKFDMHYGVSLEAIDGLSDNELGEIAALLK